MGDMANRMLVELSDGYNAVTEAVIHHGSGSEVSYESGYADGWADAMHHAAWAMDGEDCRPLGKNAFPLFSARNVRWTALRLIKARRAEKSR